MPYINRRFPIGPPLVEEILVREDEEEEEKKIKSSRKKKKKSGVKSRVYIINY